MAEHGAPSVWEVILDQKWLLGGLLSVLSAVLACLGLVVQKASHYQVHRALHGPINKKNYHKNIPKWRSLLASPKFFLGLFLFVAASALNVLAIKYAPETTVRPLGAVQVLLNFTLSYGLLNERFYRKDIIASFLCMLAALVMNLAMPGNLPGYMESFPVQEALEFAEGLKSNAGFAAYLMVWSALFFVCLVIHLRPTLRVAAPVALPILVGLLWSQFHFVAKIASTLVFHEDMDPALRTTEEWNVTCRVLLVTAALYVAAVAATCEGLRHLACRYFLPATFMSVTALTFLEVMMFFREWMFMSAASIIVFCLSLVVGVVGVSGISPAHRVVSQAEPRSPRNSPGNSPLLDPSVDPIKYHQPILEVMQEYKFQKRSSNNPKPLELIDMSVPFRNKWRLVPLLANILVLAVPVALWFGDCVFSAFIILTIYSVYNGWKMGFHIALFAYVGCKKVALFDIADFKKLYEVEVVRTDQLEGAPAWEHVTHFVILPNYKEDFEVLRLAIKSVAQSNIAAQQIVLVLAMEAREAGSDEKAGKLMREFEAQFLHVYATYHPSGLPGETPGKSSNTKWAGKQVFDEFMPKHRISAEHAIFTVADADSEFHSEYFAALTYQYIYAGGQDGETPERYLTIWQPPILHMKNYITQPAIVRLASFVTSLHELANLADPNATRVPYSTYSISALLVQAVGGWDPDWIDEDWHMALKCFLASSGRLKISPIFFPVINYAPEGDTLIQTLDARWTQAKRHALGYSEVVYWFDHYPRVFGSTYGRWEKTVLLWRGFFIWIKLMMIHLVMASMWAIGPFNGAITAWFCLHEQPQDLDINSWTFLLNLVCQCISFLSFNGIFVVSVFLYEEVRDRIEGADKSDLPVYWTNRYVHIASVMLQSMLYLPFFLWVAAAAEWVAAVKCIKGHLFRYDVAAKPQLDKKIAEAARQNGA